jgi:hypothetical protein
MICKHFTTDGLLRRIFGRPAPKPKHREFDGHLEHCAIRSHQIKPSETCLMAAETDRHP